MRPLDADMFDRDCAPRGMPVKVGDKWTPLLLRCLEEGPRRFGELRTALHWVTPKVLTESLRALERDGFVARSAYDENPPRVEYALTALGRTLLPPLEIACAWAREHAEQVEQARARVAGSAAVEPAPQGGRGR